MNLARSAATVGAMTMISRVLGFVRDIAIAAILGTGPVADAFIVAFRFPNLFRRWFGEGAFNAAFVPLFTKHLEGQEQGKDSGDDARKFAEQVLSVLLTALIIFTVLAEIFMPYFVLLLAPGFADTPEKFALAVLYTRIAFPYLLCMSLVALLSGVLNSLRKFAVAAAAPIILNVVFLIVLFIVIPLYAGTAAHQGVLLSWGVSVAGVLQLVVLYVACVKCGLVLLPRRPKLTPGVRRFLKLGIPGIIAGGIIQINIVIGTIIASLQDGANAYLYYADRLYQLPLGVIGIAIGVVLLPDLSRKLRAGQDQAAMDTQNRALEFSLALTLPAAVALAIIATPIISVMFERGAFTSSDTQATAAALAMFALGLPAFVLNKVFSPGFFAREDTKTPMIFAAIAVALNIALSLALFPALGHVAIAIASSVSGWVNALLLIATLKKRGAYRIDRQARFRLPRLCFAAAMMGVCVWLLAGLLLPWLGPQNPLMVKVLALAALVAAGIVFYCLVGLATRGLSRAELLGWLKRDG